MSTYGRVAFVTSSLLAAALGFGPPAVAAPTAIGSAADTVNRLEADGYTVIVVKLGTAPLSQCTATAVRPGRDITGRVVDATGRVGQPGSQGRGSTEALLYTTVYVDAKC